VKLPNQNPCVSVNTRPSKRCAVLLLPTILLHSKCVLFYAIAPHRGGGPDLFGTCRLRGPWLRRPYTPQQPRPRARGRGRRELPWSMYWTGKTSSARRVRGGRKGAVMTGFLHGHAFLLRLYVSLHLPAPGCWPRPQEGAQSSGNEALATRKLDRPAVHLGGPRQFAQQLVSQPCKLKVLGRGSAAAPNAPSPHPRFLLILPLCRPRNSTKRPWNTVLTQPQPQPTRPYPCAGCCQKSGRAGALGNLTCQTELICAPV
jgi:hypothetical protein